MAPYCSINSDDYDYDCDCDSDCNSKKSLFS